MSKKPMDYSQAEEIDGLNNGYLASGHGRGRLNSAATVYGGKVGYFGVHSILVDGVEQETISFFCPSEEEAIVVTHFPAIKKSFERDK